MSIFAYNFFICNIDDDNNDDQEADKKEEKQEKGEGKDEELSQDAQVNKDLIVFRCKHTYHQRCLELKSRIC